MALDIKSLFQMLKSGNQSNELDNPQEEADGQDNQDDVSFPDNITSEDMAGSEDSALNLTDNKVKRLLPVFPISLAKQTLDLDRSKTNNNPGGNNIMAMLTDTLKNKVNA